MGLGTELALFDITKVERAKVGKDRLLQAPSSALTALGMLQPRTFGFLQTVVLVVPLVGSWYLTTILH